VTYWSTEPSHLSRLFGQWTSPVVLSVFAFAFPAILGAQEQQQALAPAGQAAPAPARRPPVLNRANELLPLWLRVQGEFRERMKVSRCRRSR